jgi:Rieske Fe-S protein
MTAQSHQGQAASRRCVLLGASTLGVVGVVGVLSGCSTAAVPYDANDAGQAPGLTPATVAAPASAAPPAGTAAAGGAANGGQTGTVLGPAAAVPVGSGTIYATAKVIVTQPTRGVFKAFSAICTHVGCLCNQVASGTIDCPCHGSKFNITDGSVVAGPAPSPLPAKTISVTDGKILLLLSGCVSAPLTARSPRAWQSPGRGGPPVPAPAGGSPHEGTIE